MEKNDNQHDHDYDDDCVDRDELYYKNNTQYWIDSMCAHSYLC